MMHLYITIISHAKKTLYKCYDAQLFSNKYDSLSYIFNKRPVHELFRKLWFCLRDARLQNVISGYL